MAPRCCSRIWWQMASPRPSPWSLVVKNGSKIFARAAAGMPLPSSMTCASTIVRAPPPPRSILPNSGLRLTFVASVSVPPDLMASIAFLTRLWKTCTSRSSSPRIGGRLGSYRRTMAHAVHLAGQDRRVLGQPRLARQLAREELDGAADGAQRVADLVREADGHAAGGGQRLAAPHLGLELADAREVAQHGHRAVDVAVLAEERRGDEAHGHLAPVGALDQRLCLRAALAAGERLGQPPHDRGVAGEDLLQQPPLRAARRALGQHLGRRVPEHDAQLGVDGDNCIRKARENGFKIHCSGGREAGFGRGWPVRADAGSVRSRRQYQVRNRVEIQSGALTRPQPVAAGGGDHRRVVGAQAGRGPVPPPALHARLPPPRLPPPRGWGGAPREAPPPCAPLRPPPPPPPAPP